MKQYRYAHPQSCIDELLLALQKCEKELGIRDDFVPLGPALKLAPVIRDAVNYTKSGPK